MNNNIQDQEVLRQIEREVRMQEGASKLLAACSQREQALEASKSLLTCNARILALLSQLQKMRKAEILQSAEHRPPAGLVACAGKVALSDLRIPLMWKDSEYFKNKGELQRCAVFCLLHCGSEIRDTDLVMVDRTLTDICFDDVVIFNKVAPEFELRVELYSSCVVEDSYPGPLRPRRGSRTLGSLSGKKIRAALEPATLRGYFSTGGGDLRPENIPAPLSPALCSLGPKFKLLAHATLTIQHVQEGFKTHDLTLPISEDSPFWLPLYGSMCCRLVAQPLCMIQSDISGPLKVKLENDTWETFHGVLRMQMLVCYGSEDDLDFGNQPLLEIPVHKDSVVEVCEADPAGRRCVHIHTRHRGQSVTYMFAAYSPEDTQLWIKALQQHAYNMGEWKQCCDNLMEIEAPSPRRSSTVKQGSLFQEIVKSSSLRKDPRGPGVSLEIHSLLSSYYRESY